MKAPNKGNRPCPILQEDGGDYLAPCHFKTSLESVSSPAPNEAPIYKFSIAVDLLCDPLQKLIDDGKAKIVVCLEQDTVRQFLDFKPGMEISIDASTLKLSTNVDITPLIVATSSFAFEFDPAFMDEMYGMFEDQSFGVENCQILGYGSVAHLHTNAIRGLSQIVAIRELKKRDSVHPFILELDGDKIIINANPEITQNIKIIQSNSNHLEGLVNSTFAYTVFYMVIEHMVDNPSAYSSWRWYSAITNKINSIRVQKGEQEFVPETFATDFEGEGRSDEIWTLVSQLLTDNKDQLMLMSFKRAGEFAEGVQR